MTVPDSPAPAAGPAARRWADDLAAWRIPDEILAQAPQTPWIHPVALFVAGEGPAPDTPSHARARERLGGGGSVLDVGCGGGRAALAVAPPATLIIGIDHQQGMLDAFATAAAGRGLDHQEILGDWPEAARQAPDADVVVCHHVVYNVADLPAFATALTQHARRRVVLELPQRHPLSGMAPLWRHFWNLERPAGPTARDALAVLQESGLPAKLQEWEEDPGDRGLARVPPQQQVEFMRIRLCLTPDRDGELAEVLTRLPQPPRHVATLHWDTTG